MISDKTYNGVQKKLWEAIVADDKAINVASSNMTLDEWFEKWMDTCRKNPRRVLTVKETELFLAETEKIFYYNLFVVALETGMRIGELLGL